MRIALNMARFLAVTSRSKSRLLIRIITSIILLALLLSENTSFQFRAARRDFIRYQTQHRVSPGKVAVYDSHQFHDEVHGSILWALVQFSSLEILFYRPPWRWRFQEVIHSFWTEEPRDPKLFLDDLRADSAIGHVVLATCDWEWKHIGRDLEVIWEDRDASHKFDILCFRHWPDSSFTRALAPFVLKQAISLMGLGDHVGRGLRSKAHDAIDAYINKPEEAVMTTAYNLLPIRTFVPIFPPDLSVAPAVTTPTSDASLTVALIQSSSWDEKHRSLNATFTTLESALQRELLYRVAIY